MENKEMNKHVLTFGTIMVLLFVIVSYIATDITWYKVYLMGQYYANAGPFMAVLFGLWPLIGAVIAFFICWYVIKAHKNKNQ